MNQHLSSRKVRGRVATWFGLAIGLTLAIAGCSGEDGPVVRVYSGRHYDLEQAFDQFTEETGIEVEFLTGTDAELRERIEAEGDETAADVYMTVDAGNLATADAQGLFTPLDSDVLDAAVPASLRGPEGSWYGLTIRARTIVYNPERVATDEVPTTYEELADPAWEGRLCLRNSSNIYTQSLVASLLAHHGEEEATRIVAGWTANAEIMEKDSLILASIAAGECDAGITNHYYLARELEEDADFPVELTWAHQDGRGVHVNVSGGGVTKYAAHPEEAQQLLEWLATDGQSLFVDGNHEYPVNPEAKPVALIAENFGESFVMDELDASIFGGLNADAVRLMDEVGYR